MSRHYDSPESLASVVQTPGCLGLVVHPSRNIDAALHAVHEWSDARGVQLLQLAVPGQHRRVGEPGNAGECDLIVAVGGDGTTLAAIHAGAAADRPILGVGYGSLGVLTSVAPDGLVGALDRFSRGDWEPRMLPALELICDDLDGILAFNDVAIVRGGAGQVRVVARIDGVLFGRFAGDGCIVSTPVGSSAYTIAAGGPLLAPDTDGFVLTPLPIHGGFCPPLVIGAGSELQLETSAGHGGARLDSDGQVAGTHIGSLTIRLRPAAATVVGFVDQEPLLTGLRRRGVIIDSARILAEDTPG
jgi:NAD+ kinase